jgi:DNA-binding transcriptional ArsR family regulator
VTSQYRYGDVAHFVTFAAFSVCLLGDCFCMERATLEQLVEERLTTRQIAEAVGRSQSTVRYWLRRYGLTTVRARRDDELVGKYVTRVCQRHGEARFVLEGRGYFRCTRCRAERVAERRRRVKAELVAEAGGRCAICGYDRYLGALNFHHLDPSEKSFGVARGGVTLGIERMRAEARKCMLLCANCHAEVEAGVISATLFRQLNERDAA